MRTFESHLALFIGRCAAVVALAVAYPVMGQPAWPNKPVRLIVNFAAGGSTDVIARAMATRLSESLGQAIVVDNRVGVGGNVGLEAAAKASADGYTLLHSSDGTILVNPFLYRMAVDVERELDPVAPTAKAAIFFIVRPGLPVRNLAELIAYARANPGKLNYGSAGNGTLQHIAAEMLMRVANIKVTHVPYKGSQQALVDLLGGAIDFTFDLGAAIGHIKSEKVRLLAVPGPTRSPIFPEAPTMAEAGANVDITWMSGVYAPAGTPNEIVTRLNREIGRIMQMPETRATLTNMAAEAVAPMTPQAFAAHQKQARQRFGAVVRDAGIKVQ
ncbi:MAG TPA: tripartite tricarboxylate transporter substrate binding protein [Burkholderiales bacterium]|nr:tripartite tricarboxylate transporter substrate binding protein [Burkholderiales bacterium]